MKTFDNTWLGRGLAPLALAALVWGASSPRANAASASASATVNVVDPAMLVKTDDLRFGAFAPDTADGVVTIATSGARAASGGIVLFGGSPFGAARFVVTKNNAALKTFTVSSPTSATSITIRSGANTMTVDTFTQTPANSPPKIGGRTIELLFGGTIHVGANQTPGSYAGTFDVTVAWE